METATQRDQPDVTALLRGVPSDREAPPITTRTSPQAQDPSVRGGSRRRGSSHLRRWIALIAVALGVVVGIYLWPHFRPAPLPPGIAVSNGRLEATQIDIATKLSGRIAAVLVQEGDFVETGQIVARMDTSALDAQLREAEANFARARTAVATAEALVAQRRSELELATQILRRSENLVRTGFISQQKLDTDRAQQLVARATLAAAQSQVTESQAAVQASVATLERIQSDVDESVLRAPTRGRVQYRLAQPGEVLAAGGKVINMLDLSDVYMTAFLSAASAGQLRMHADARLVLDAAPGYVIPASVRFIADQAQFTPKTVETAVEREKLVFRVKVQIDPELAARYWTQIKAGMPGVAYVRTDEQAQWPASLAIRLPPQ